MLNKHHFEFYEAQSLKSRKPPEYNASDLLKAMVATRICEKDRQGDAPTLTPEGLRRAQIALVNGAKAISYSQEVQLELNQMVSQMVPRKPHSPEAD